MATKSEVRNTAAGYLGRRRLGQAITDDVKTRLDEAYATVYDQLKDEGLNIWASTGTIPDRVKTHLAALMAWDAKADIPMTKERYNQLLIDYQRAMPLMREYLKPDWESQDEPEDF